MRASAWGALKSVGWRSLFIQSCWNFEKMQNIGFAWAALPALRRLYPDPEKRRTALLRHAEFFNTHPYMASLVLGSSLKVEEDCLAQGKDPAPAAGALKAALMSPLAAMGDALFWATLRPLAAILGVALGWMAPEAGLEGALLCMILVFNLPHFALRAWGLLRGYQLGGQVALFLRSVDPQGLIASLRIAGLVVLGSVLGAFAGFVNPASQARMPFGDELLFVLAGLVMLMLLRLKVGVVKILCAALACALLLAYMTFPQP